MRRITPILLVLLVASCGGEEATPPETTTTTEATATTAAPTTTESPTTTVAPSDPNLTITIVGFRFSGDETGAVGDTVAVTNEDTVSHTWTSTDGAFHSGTLGEGETFVYTFDEAGDYAFFCQIHPEMSGSIAIEG